MTSKTNTSTPDNNGMVPLTSLTGSALTKAIRAWAVENGHEVPARGALPMNVIMAASTSGAMVDPSAFDARTVYVLTAKDGKAYTVTGPRGKATLDGLAESVGLDPEHVQSCTKDGELFALPRRASGTAPAPWTVRTRDGKAFQFTASTRGKASPAEVAVACGIPVERIESMSRDGSRYLVEVTYRFTRG